MCTALNPFLSCRPYAELYQANPSVLERMALGQLSPATVKSRTRGEGGRAPFHNCCQGRTDKIRYQLATIREEMIMMMMMMMMTTMSEGSVQH